MANTRNWALAWVLSLALALTLLPVNALAEGDTPPEQPGLETEITLTMDGVNDKATPGWTTSAVGEGAGNESWDSGNEAVATVKDGVITAVSEGEATITHTYYVEAEKQTSEEDENIEGNSDDSSDEATVEYVEKMETVLVTVEAAQTSSDSVNTGTAGSGTESSGTEVNSALSDLQKRIYDLPTVSELEGMEADEVEEVYLTTCDIWDMIDELSEEDAATLDLTKLEALSDYFAEPVAQPEEDEKPEQEETIQIADENDNVVYEGPVIPAEPEETDTSIYETIEAVKSALDSAEESLSKAEAANKQWSANFSDAYSRYDFGAPILIEVSKYATQATNSQKAWTKWVDKLTERWEELFAANCTCENREYACTEKSHDEECPVCKDRPDLCQSQTELIKSESYWEFYYNKATEEGILKIIGDYKIAESNTPVWPWDSRFWDNEFSTGAGSKKFIGDAITTVLVEDNVTKIGNQMFSKLPNVETFVFGRGVKQWVSEDRDSIVQNGIFGSKNIKKVTVYSPTFDTKVFSSGDYHIETLTLDNPAMEIFRSLGLSEPQQINVSNIVITSAKSVGDAAFYSDETNAKIQTLQICPVESIGASAFKGCANLTGEVKISDGCTYIGASAFEGCKKLIGNIVIPESCTYIGEYAFHDCDQITITIPASTQLGYSNIFSKFEPLRERMEAILAGKFALNETSHLDVMSVPNGWTSSQLGSNNGIDDGDTQVSKAARWADTDRTRAEVEFQFNYDKPRGMDFVFVVDYSASMASVGNRAEDNDSRFTSMQSKLLDVTEELLNTPGYDNQVAFITFATDESELYTCPFTEDYNYAKTFILGHQPGNHTNYSIALAKAYELITTGRGDNPEREAAVIFISDGMPNAFLNGTLVSGNQPQLIDEITDYANKIKEIKQFDNQATKIFSVLQSVPTSSQGQCSELMKDICTDGLFYLASDTEEFSDAINNAIWAAYNVYTLVDTIDPSFTLVESSIKVSAGDYEIGQDAAGNTTITWTITGRPYDTHTMSYDLTLNPKDGAYPTGTFDTNEGNATITLDGELVNQVATPQLNRNFSYTVTIHYVDQNGNHIIDPVTLDNEYSENETVELRQQLTRSFNGYTWERIGTNSNLDGYTLTMPAGNVDLYVYYTKDTYSVQVNYLDVDTGREIADPYLSDISYGYEDEYDVTDALRESIDRYDLVAGEYALTGTVYGDVVINLYYERSYTPRPDPGTDPDPDPDRPGDGDDTTDIADEEVPLAELPGLNKEDHFAYIIGYEDGTVRPEGYITRAEVATIFFRLMTDEYRETYWATSNHFIDVAQANWYNNGVSTTANVGWIAGYPDGTYRPNNNITRAEFATIAARFLSGDYNGGNMFTDIDGHWAADYINRAAAIGWITGYAGQFRPDDYITRAEAVTLINRMLDRAPDADHMLENMIRWPDNPETAWYYEAIQEATNSHDYDRETIIDFETWTVLLENRDWAALEELWAQAADATGGEVADNLTPNVPGDDN